MKVLVIFHIYYPELAQYYLEKMKNIHSCEWKLIVTGPSLTDGIKEQIRAVKADAEFINTDNRGYDIWPFICAIKTVDLAEYDFVIKLHTKNHDKLVVRLNGVNMDGERWKEYMVSALLGSPEKFSGLLEVFRPGGKAGIAYSRQLGFISKEVNPEDCEMLDDEIARLGIRRKKSHFCAGTMFAAKASALTFLQDERINAEIFENSGPTHGSATMAHVYERLIPIAIQAQGYRFQPLYDSTSSAILFKIKDALTPAAEWIFSINFYRGREHKRIILFGMPIIFACRK